ncbi:hypothetical protein [Stakelama tenebrarum]|uniref:Lipoprotein n=1 Tax=Stakelama tenebrarum TaxID=2711215 RepID=A0A6G6Y7X5_9SPHN|nr:hypothetical protein [Sphingosinithalassobacter tenebrarum]QIG81044.1 hypothetical protein G5C33_15470 [Sphingosinithalassobacter tenebrarum]
MSRMIRFAALAGAPLLLAGCQFVDGDGNNSTDPVEATNPPAMPTSSPSPLPTDTFAPANSSAASNTSAAAATPTSTIPVPGPSPKPSLEQAVQCARIASVAQKDDAVRGDLSVEDAMRIEVRAMNAARAEANRRDLAPGEVDKRRAAITPLDAGAYDADRFKIEFEEICVPLYK